ncbi:LADA_0A01068g1_1 [Lachancea dasiensis]|uniref:LADA_0A01068g1_1 n=1 Tax=Lachancea dasiensis TaxID=1072105 RepID=A0A1G4ILS8_9SACH|nr:LADA_0A01068g1_1 [Lachancea dasiensis]
MVAIKPGVGVMSSDARDASKIRRGPAQRKITQWFGQTQSSYTTTGPPGIVTARNLYEYPKYVPDTGQIYSPIGIHGDMAKEPLSQFFSTDPFSHTHITIALNSLNDTLQHLDTCLNVTCLNYSAQHSSSNSARVRTSAPDIGHVRYPEKYPFSSLAQPDKYLVLLFDGIDYQPHSSTHDSMV